MTDADGRYCINGMNAGGPYLVDVTYTGFKTTTLSGIILQVVRNFLTGSTGKFKKAGDIATGFFIPGKKHD